MSEQSWVFDSSVLSCLRAVPCCQQVGQLGDYMASLEVNAGGLRVAAANSDDAATSLTSAATDGPTGSRPSSAGVSAFDAAIDAVRGRQSSRITGQASALSAGASRYDGTDRADAEAITVTV